MWAAGVSGAFFLEQLLNGLQLGALLFLLAAGLTLVLSVMNLVNLAHGSLYMLGAYFTASVLLRTGSFGLALALGVLATAVLGLILEATVLRPLYERDPLDQVVCTFGLILIANEVTRIIWGPVPLPMSIPAALSTAVNLFGIQYSTFRLFVIGIGIATAVSLMLLLNRTRIGMLVRAGASDRMMIEALGTNITHVNHVLFALGAALAGLAGALSGPLLAVQVGMGEPVLIVSLVVIVIGGLGSVRGSFAAAMLVGLIDTFGRVLLPPAIGSIIIYLFMAAMLFWRPDGLFPVPGGAHAGLNSMHARLSLLKDAARVRLPFLNLRTLIVAVTLVAFGLVPVIALIVDEPFYMRFFTRTMLFAIVAVSLGLLVNFGGLASFGHAAFVGIGAYVTAILSFHHVKGTLLLGFIPGTQNAYIAWPAAIVVSAAAAFVIGAVSLRTRGLHFIMITLAFAQMLYYFFISLPTYGGESGLQIDQRSKLWPLDLDNRLHFYYLVFGTLLLCLAVLNRLVRSPFGLLLDGCRQNDRRMRAIGIDSYRYRLGAFTLAGAIAGAAGALMANFQTLATPAEMAWSRSGEYLIMVIIGGAGTLFGPVIGALVLQVLELVLEGWTEHWHILLGLFLVAAGLAGTKLAFKLPFSARFGVTRAQSL